MKKVRIFIFLHICLWFLIFSFWFCNVTNAATLYFLPSSNEIPDNESFMIEARIDTENQSINTIDAKIIYPKDVLEVMDISNGSSVVDLWPEAPKIKNGEIAFVGGIPNGFVGDGKLFSIILTISDVVTTSDVNLSWSATSKILLNDGAGTEAAKKFLEGNYKIIAKEELLEINSPDHPDQNKWYASKIVEINWEQTPGSSYSYIVSKDPLAEPDDEPDFTTPEGLPAEALAKEGIELSGLENGVYYFHLKEIRPSQEVESLKISKSTFRIMIDNEKPEIIEVKVDKDPQIFDNQYFLSFIAKDNVSGIDRTLVAETPPGESASFSVLDPRISALVLKDQSRKSEIKIKAIDKAGNEIIYTIPPLKITPCHIYIFFFVSLIILIALIILITLKKSRKKDNVL